MNDMSHNDLTMTINRRIGAPPAKVYDAWLDPEKLIQFMANCKGMTLASATTDPRVGGRFSMVMNTGEKDIPHAGTYLELTPHSRIAFTWESQYSTVEGSTVTLDLQPDGAATLLTLTHVRFANEGSRDGHKSGWSTILDGLAATTL
ncbi:MAG: SRPBCC family protein [Paracoccaceae bacterium]